MSRNSRASKTARLICYENSYQNLGTSASTSTDATLPSSTPVKLVEAVALQQITESDTQSHQLIILQQDGALSCYSQKLGKLLWNTELNSLPTAADAFDLSEDFRIDHAELTTLEVAQQGLLKGRPDALAVLSSSNDLSTPVLVVLGTSPSLRYPDNLDLDMHIYSLPTKFSDARSLSKRLPQQILSWSLPREAKRTQETKSEYVLASSTGLLTELCDGKTITYNLSGLSPRLADSYFSNNHPGAAIRISPSLLLTASSSIYAVYDSKFGSVLASHSITGLPSTPSKKRKSMESYSSTPTSFVGYFVKSGIAVALRGDDLVAIQIGAEAKSAKRQKTGTLLVDSLGKGSLPSRSADLSNGIKKSHSAKRKREAKEEGAFLFVSSELDELIEQNDVDEFERKFAAAVHINIENDEANGNAEATSGTNSTTQWSFPSQDQLHSFPPSRPEALYALSRIFESTTTAEEREQLGGSSSTQPIRLKFYPDNVFSWLVHTGQLRADLIQRALAQYYGSEQTVPHGAVVQALAEFEPSLGLVHYLLIHHPHPDVDELVTAVKVIVNSLDDSTMPQPEQKVVLDKEFANAATTAGALTNGVTGLTNGDVSMTNGHAKEDEEEEEDSIADAEMDDIDDMVEQARELLDEGLPIRGESLRQALTKLNLLSTTVITKHLRAKLSLHELVFLIHILRLDLEQGGWTSRYGGEEETDFLDIADEPSNRAITVLTNMMSCAVDALGMRGWVTASASQPIDSIDETLDLLRAEISATLEGVHEATFCHGVLADFLRHHYKRTKSFIGNGTEVEMEERWKAGKTVIVEKRPSAHLPVGLGVEELEIKQKVELEKRHLSGVTRIKRPGEIGKEIRRGLPVYVFERIRF